MNKGKEVNDRLTGFIVFLVVLCLYLTVLIALANILSILLLAGLVWWVIKRRPFSHPGRIDEDLRRFSRMAGHCIEKLLRTLIKPLDNGRSGQA
jgi:hypothetical protein